MSTRDALTQLAADKRTLDEDLKMCVGCDTPTTEGKMFVFGMMCPACDRKWDVLCDALEGVGETLSLVSSESTPVSGVTVGLALG